jgi:SPP1 family predicted phage head-tail adaptor
MAEFSFSERARAGRYRQRITLQTKVEARDALGTPAPVWSDVLTFYGRVVPVSAAEPINAAQFGGRADHSIECRYLGAAIVPAVADRLAFRGRVLDLVGVLDVDSLHRVYRLYAVEATTP